MKKAVILFTIYFLSVTGCFLYATHADIPKVKIILTGGHHER